MTSTKTRKPARKTSTPEERQAKLDAALNTLKTGVAALVESDQWADYLAFQASFHKYSARNVLMLMVQMPTASQVAGYRAWQALGRQVRKGERGLAILAPCKYTVEDEATGDKRSFIKGFRVEHVWDVSQTDGEDLPSVVRLLDGAGDDTLHAGLVAQIQAAGFTYSDEPTGSSANGYTAWEERRVVVDSGLSPAQRVKTTAHELAHVLLHDPADPDRPAERGLLEVEAESVSYIVLTALGFAADEYSLGYVAGWSGGSVAVVETVAARVQRCAARVLELLTA